MSTYGLTQLTQHIQLTQLGQDYLFGRTQLVEIQNTTYRPYNLTSGVPQGSILGPLIFVFFNNLKEPIDKLVVITYADGTVIFYADKEVQSIEML